MDGFQESLFRLDSGKWIPLYYISQLSVKARKRLELENLSANPFNLPTLFSGLQQFKYREREKVFLCVLINKTSQFMLNQIYTELM